MATTAERPTQSPPGWLRDVLARASLRVPPRVTRLQGRNESYLVEGAGRSVVVKRLVGPASADRFARSVAHAAYAAHDPGVPELVHVDEPLRVLVFGNLVGAVSGNALLVQERFTPQLCAQVGLALGRLHSAPPAGSELPRRAAALPTERMLRALPLEAVNAMTAGEVDAWRLIQSDESLLGYVGRLREHSAAAEPVSIHGDLRIDQVLVADEAAYLVDWEEFGPGDPAYDTGSWVGEWVYRAVLDIPTARGDGVGTDESHGVLEHRGLDADEIVRRGVAKLDALSPQIVAFWDAYRAERAVDADELARVTGYAGWHLLDRLLALAHSKAVLPGVPRAAAGVGKRLLANPAGAAEALGLRPSAPGTGVAA